MKKLLLFLVIASAFLLNLSAESYKANNKVIINGTIKNAQFNQIRIGDHQASLDKDGNFKLTCEIKEPDYVALWYGKEMLLFLTPGDRLTLTLDTEDFFNTMKFIGKGAEVNNFLAHVAILNEKHIMPLNFDELFSLEEKDFRARIESLEAIYQQAFEEFLTSHENINQKFIKFEQARIRYSWANTWLLYPNKHRQITRKKALDLSHDYDDYLSRLDFNDPDLLSLQEYSSFLNNYLNTKSEEALETDASLKKLDNQHSHAAFKIALKTFTNQSFKNYFLHSIMKKQIQDYGIKGIDDLMKSFKENCNDKRLISEINELYNQDAALRKGYTAKVYKTINNITLDLHIYSPPDLKPGDKRPAIVYFHGGGWSYGKPEWSMGLNSYFPPRGIAVISVQYRLIHRHGVTPLDSISDAKSAIRWIRQHASELGIDPNRIAAAGMSAGGHLAACTAILEGFDESEENLNISSIPDALILFAAVINTGYGRRFEDLLKGRATGKDCSPVHHIRPALPPTIMFQGRSDESVPMWTVDMFNRKMEQAGNRCDLHTFSGGHFFINEDAAYREVIRLTEKFLDSIGFDKK